MNSCVASNGSKFNLYYQPILLYVLYKYLCQFSVYTSKLLRNHFIDKIEYIRYIFIYLLYDKTK